MGIKQWTNSLDSAIKKIKLYYVARQHESIHGCSLAAVSCEDQEFDFILRACGIFSVSCFAISSKRYKRVI